MPLSLPTPVSTYFRISNGESAGERIADVFTPDATVHDEGRSWQGINAIDGRQRAARAKFDYVVEPLEATADGERLVVATRVSGNFPGSPVRLDHVFSLDGDRIRTLEIS